MSYSNVKNFRKRLKEKIVKLMGGKCQCCGYNKCYRSLEIHHVDPSKKEFTVSQMMVLNWKKTVDECQKCVLVCANCHREIHDNMTQCPPIKTLNYESLSDWFIDWDMVDLTTESKNLTVKEISMKYGINPATISNKCRKENIKTLKEKRVSKFLIDVETLEKLVKEMPMTKIGDMYGVSDNAIRKRCKVLGIQIPSFGRGYWTKNKQ
jgi:glycerophosphoryl diester phosphodiesterase